MESGNAFVAFWLRKWWGATLVVMLLGGCAGKPAPDPLSTASVPLDTTRPAGSTEAIGSDTAPASAALLNGPVTFEAAVQRAVSWHPAIAETMSRLRQQEASVREAEAAYLPTLGWGIDSAYDNEPGGGYRPLVNLTGSQMIYDFGKVSGEVDVAQAGVEERRTRVLAAIDSLARETAYAAIEIKRAESLRSVAEDQLADTQDILELVAARTEKGANTRSDLLQAESRVDAAEATLLETEAQLRRSKAILAALLGAEGDVDLAGAIPSWLDKTCLQSEPEWSSMPAIMQARAEQEAAEAQLGLSRAEALPTLSLDGQVGTDITALGSEEPEYSIGLNISGNLYNGNASAARKDAAIHALAASKANIARTRVEIRRSLLEASSQVDSLKKLAISLGERIDTMSQTRKLYETQYIDLGTRTLLDLLNSAQELHAVRLDLRNVRHDIHTLSVDCLFNLGTIRDAFSLNTQVAQRTVIPL